MVCLLTIGPTRHSLVFVLPTHRGMARLSWAEFHAGVVYSHIPVPARPEVQHCDQYRHAISCCREDVAFVNNIENLKKKSPQCSRLAMFVNVYFKPQTRSRQYCLVLSCPCLRCEMNSEQVKTVGDRKLRNWTGSAFCSLVLSRNAVWIEFCLVLTQFPICN